MEERRIKIKNNNKQTLKDDLVLNDDRETLRTELLSTVNNEMKMLYKSKNNINPFYNAVYNEKTLTITLKERDEHIFSVFNYSDCKQLYDKKCQCNYIYKCDGYYIVCSQCELRIPRKGLAYALTENIKAAFVKYGLINYSNNRMTKYETMKTYPISMDNFQFLDQKELFVKVLEHHNYQDIVNYFEYHNNKNNSYRCYKDGTIYNRDNELLSEIEFYHVFSSFFYNEINRIIYFYEQHKEYPIIDEVCYNRHIIFNMNVLKEVLNEQRENLTKYLLKMYDTNELTYIHYKNKQFTDNIYYVNNIESIIKLNDIYNKYLEWRSIRESTDTQLTKAQLRDKIIEHLDIKYPDKKDKLIYSKSRYRDPNHVDKSKYYGWRYVEYDINIRDEDNDNLIIPKKGKCEANCGLRVTDKYKGYCLRCFIYTFPDQVINKKYKVKEQYVVDFIKKTYSNMVFTFDKQINSGCSKRRPDIYIDLYTHVIVIECDENQHKSYENICENKRIMEISNDFANRPIVFIRFNPDSYTKNNKKIKSCFEIVKAHGVYALKNKDDWSKRLLELKKLIDYYLDFIPEKTITNEYLFFDS